MGLGTARHRAGRRAHRRSSRSGSTGPAPPPRLAIPCDPTAGARVCAPRRSGRSWTRCSRRRGTGGRDARPGQHRLGMLLERLGFRYQGRAVGGAFVRGEWVDDDRYAITGRGARGVAGRPTRRPATSRLVEVTEDNRRKSRARRPITARSGSWHRWRPRSRTPLKPEVRAGAPSGPGSGPSRRTARSVGLPDDRRDTLAGESPVPVAAAHRPAPPGPRHRPARGGTARGAAPAPRVTTAAHELGPRQRRPEPFYLGLGSGPTGASSTRASSWPSSLARLSHPVGASPASRRRKPSSSSTGTPSSCALASFEPAFSPATR